MRKIVLLAVPALLAVACGSSSKSATSGQSGPMSGTVAGRAFTPKAAQAIKGRHGGCSGTFQGATVNFGADAVMIEATSAGADPAAASTLACDDLDTSTVTCQYHQNARTLAIIVGKATVTPTLDPTVIPTLTTGTYTVVQDPSAIAGASGSAFVTLLDADACSSTSTMIAKTGGTVEITDLSGPITGTVNLTFDNGSISGTFSAPLCGDATSTVCDRASNVMTTGSLCATSCVNP